MIDVATAQRFHNKDVNMNVDTGIDDEGNPTFTTKEGRVLVVGPGGIALRNRNNTVIIDLNAIMDIEESKPRRRRVIVRYVRKVGPDNSIKQHLADRHGVFVSVLNAVDDETAQKMHNNTKHDDLGHRHEPRPTRNGQAVEIAEEAMELLDDEE